ncbi:MAG: hypothetical protein ACYC3X_15620 [Pirellulaceae bacterium]
MKTCGARLLFNFIVRSKGEQYDGVGVFMVHELECDSQVVPLGTSDTSPAIRWASVKRPYGTNDFDPVHPVDPVSPLLFCGRDERD